MSTAYSNGGTNGSRSPARSNGILHNGGNGVPPPSPSPLLLPQPPFGATQVAATEGWLELFLTTTEKYNFSQWKEVIRDQSWVNNQTRPLFQHLATYVPHNVAPNVVTLTGFLSLGQACYLTHTYGDQFPLLCTMLSIFNILLFYVTNILTDIHAVRIRQQTSLSDLFKYCCDSGSTVFFSILLCYSLGASTSTLNGNVAHRVMEVEQRTHNLETHWYAVQASQLVLLLKHLSAYKRGAGLRYRPGAGPGEVLMLGCGLLAARAVIGLHRLDVICQQVLSALRQFILTHVVDTSTMNLEEREWTSADLVRWTYYILFVSALVQTLLLPNRPHGFTRFALSVSLCGHLLPALLLQYSTLAFARLTLLDVICDGLFMAVLTSDLIVAKMAQRQLHSGVMLMSFAAVLSHTVILTTVVTYYIAILADLCHYLNLPLLTTCRNVYCDGVYDLCHIGHKRAFQNSLRLGNRLFVGVMGDEDASTYKRPPVMTHAERCAEVECCKSVTKVIPNAPCFGLTHEFLEEHQIHVVAFGEEYLERYPDPENDPYYRVPRQLGIAHPLPRTHTLSTTDLIKRILERDSSIAEKKSAT
jgi:cytidyltransferase-like protein